MNTTDDLKWALQQLAEKLPDLYGMDSYQFVTKIGGLRLAVPVASLAMFPVPELMRSLAQEAESNGKAYTWILPTTGQPSQMHAIQYGKAAFAVDPHPLVAMILARIGVYQIPASLKAIPLGTDETP